jgi:hypothetical protein
MLYDKRIFKSKTSDFSGSGQLRSNKSRRSANLCKLFMMAMLLLISCGRNATYSMDTVIDPCKSGTYLTIDSLYDYCKVPGECRQKYEIEGKMALIKGVIDYLNVFDKTNYPNLPYQKFLMTNHEHTQSIEVWVTSDRSDLIFKEIFKQKALSPDSTVFIKGVLVGFDMPIMGACHRGLKLELTVETFLSFDVNRAESGKY